MINQTNEEKLTEFNNDLKINRDRSVEELSELPFEGDQKETFVKFYTLRYTLCV
jgi:hypothetical protein